MCGACSRCCRTARGTIFWRSGRNTTEEARLVKALDKAETILQHNQGKNPPDFDYGFNLEYGKPYFSFHPLLKELRSLLAAQTAARIREGESPGEET